VVDGKKELNFDEFNSYDNKRKKHKLDELIEVIQDDEMSLGSYSLIHRNAILSPQDKEKIIFWARKVQTSIN